MVGTPSAANRDQLNYGFWFVTEYGSLQWRFPIAFQAIFGVILIIGVLLYVLFRYRFNLLTTTACLKVQDGFSNTERKKKLLR